MFISKKQLKDLLVRLDNHNKRIKAIEEEVGTGAVNHNFGFAMFDVFYNGPKTVEAKSFTLNQKVKAILEHLGLEEKRTAETKLVKSTKKGKK